ncbi:MAG: 30S ribosomal protein S16 [Gammaproteobacteria bacterium]
MVTIRLSRGGAKKRPYYYIVVLDSRCKRDGKKLERVGFFNPMAASNEPKLQIDKARVEYWMSKGAKPSERVVDLMARHAA